jgi:hypothetical protein
MNQILPGIIFLGLALGGSGAGLQRWVRAPIDTALILPLGAAQVAGAYWLGLALGSPWVCPVLLLVSTGGLLLGLPTASAPISLRTVLLPGLALLGLLAVTQYGGNRLAPDGAFLRDPMGDQFLHAGITWELTQPYPPQVPGLAGVHLDYHYGADLVRAAALRWAGLHPYDALNRVEPTLWALGLMLGLAALARRLGGSSLAVSLAPWTVLLTDLSFVAAAFGATWWTDLLRGNLLLSLAFANPAVPALMLATSALVAFARFEAGEGRAWLLLAAVQTAAVPFFKTFLGAQLALALGVAALLALARRSTDGRAALPSLLLAAVALLGLAPLVTGASAHQVAVVLAPLDLVGSSLRQIGFENLGGATLAAATLPWLVASLGLRLIGLPGAARTAVGGSVWASACALLALLGWPLGLLFRVSARDLGGGELPSASIYFLEQSGTVLWVFAALALGARAAGWRRRTVVLALVAGAAVALPSTVEFAIRKSAVAPDRVGPHIVRAIHAVARDGQPGDVVLERPSVHRPPLPVVLVGRRVVYERFSTYLTQFAPPSTLRRHHRVLFRFFGTPDPAEALSLARSVEARYVCLYWNQGLHFDEDVLLVPVHEERGARCFRIEPDRLPSP